jgi:hypothetical protein
MKQGETERGNEMGKYGQKRRLKEGKNKKKEREENEGC